MEKRSGIGHRVPEHETPAEYLRGRFDYKRDITGTSYAMRSADYDRVGGIPQFERLSFADDALWLSLMLGSYKAADPSPLCAVRLHPDKESASMGWSNTLVGLNRLSEFLQRYVGGDAEAKAVVQAHCDSFMLAYHRNFYIRALIDACHTGGRVQFGRLSAHRDVLEEMRAVRCRSHAALAAGSGARSAQCVALENVGAVSVGRLQSSEISNAQAALSRSALPRISGNERCVCRHVAVRAHQRS